MNELDIALDAITNRRLILVKQMFLHAYDISNQNNSLSKMIAVHNFHNAIELLLRSIILTLNIRTEKTLNIDFESMLSEIDNSPETKKIGIKLPYRQEIRNLNQMRNHVQHHAIEPESSTMEYWRVFSNQFLKECYKLFYNIDFDQFSSVELINDDKIKCLLKYCNENIRDSEKKELLLKLLSIVFSSSVIGFRDFSPDEGFLCSFFITSRFEIDREVKSVIEKVIERIHKTEIYTMILNSGIMVADYKKFEEVAPRVMFAINGFPNFGSLKEKIENIDIIWVYQFVENAILTWQGHDLNPFIPDNLANGINKYLEENGIFL